MTDPTIEHAAGSGRSPFPPSWGVPRGRPGSEERAAWVAERVAGHVAGRAHARLAEVAAKRFAPVDLEEAR